MAGYIEGVDRGQATLFPDRLDDVVDADNPVRVIDVFVDALDLRELDSRRTPWRTGASARTPSSTMRRATPTAVLQVRRSPITERPSRMACASASTGRAVAERVR